MRHSDFSGNDTAPYPAPPPFGSGLPESPPDAGDDDDDGSWLQPVTYDQTDYQDLDAYLALEAGAGRPPAAGGAGAGEPAFPAADGYPDRGADAWEGAYAPRPAHAGADPDAAYADPYPYGTPVGSAQPGPRWKERPLPDEEWPPRGTRHATAPAYALSRRPRWMLPVAVGLVAAAVGSGVVIITTGSTSRSATGLPAFSAAPGGTANPAMTPAPVLISPGAAGSGSTAQGQPSAPGMSPPGTASPGMTLPGTGSPATRQPPITRSQAQQVLASYTTANNTANARASDSLIATVETGSSLAIDQGIYRRQRAGNSTGYPAIVSVSARYYIPLEDPASYPHWFAVRVTNAMAGRPGTVTGREYIVFTQDKPGGPWLDAIEPFLGKNISPPPMALDANGYAKAVSLNSAGLLMSPAAASGATASALDAGTGQPADPGNLAVDQDQAALARQLPKGGSATDRHSGTSDRVFGLRTADGGALLFYDVAARLTLTAPAGSALNLSVPGYLSPGAGARQATLTYLEQFATYDPPRRKGTLLPVIADYSGITGRG